MGLRLIRIGNKVRVGEVKSLSFRRSMRNSAVILYVVVLFAIYIAVRRAGYDIPRWADYALSFLIAGQVGIIDKQLPSRRFKNLGLLLGMMGVVFVYACTRKYLSGTLSMDVEVWIFGILIPLSLGFSSYCLWRWMRNIRRYKELALQRELRAKRKRKLEY